AEQTFPPGSFLCKEGERDGHLYFLISGEVEVSKTDADGHKHTLANLSGGTLNKQLQERSPGAFKLSTALLRLLASRLLRMNDQFLQVQIKTNGNGQKKSEIE